MSTIIISTLQRGGGGTSPFPVAKQDDLKIPHLIVPDIAARDAIEEWQRLSYMTTYVISENTTYRLGLDTTIPGQVWSIETVGSDYQLLAEKNQPNGYVGLEADGFIDPQYIRSIYVQDYFVVADEAERLALVAVTGDICNQLDTNQVFIKKNNNTPPTTNADWADITSASEVTSVNGMVGAVSITINGLLGWADNQNEFNAAVLATPAVSQLNSQVAVNTADIANIYNLLSGITGDADSLPLWDNSTAYVVGNVVLYDPGAGRKNLYRCTVAPVAGTPPTNTAFWEIIGDFYTRAEIDALLADKADLVGGKVPIDQIPVNLITNNYVVADQAGLVALQPSLVEDNRVVVMEAVSPEFPDGGVGEYIYKPGDPNADGLGFVSMAGASSKPFDWNRPIKKVPELGVTVGGDSVVEGLEEMLFGPVYPAINMNDIDPAEVGSSSQALITGEVVPNDVDSIDEIRIVRVSDDATLTTVTPATPPTATPITYSAPAVTMLEGITESYRVEVDYTIGSDSGTVVGDAQAFSGIYPMFIGNGATGLTGGQIYLLNKILTLQQNTYYSGFNGSERIYFAIPDAYDPLVSIIDQHQDEMFGSLFTRPPAVVSISSSGLVADWTQDYKVYESDYDSITNLERYGFLFTFGGTGAGGGGGSALSGSEKAKLDSIEFGAEVNPSAFEIKQLYESNTDTNAFDDGSVAKLGGIEAGAQVNQDDATIKTQYENNLDTNAFTDFYKNTLDGLDIPNLGDMREDVYVLQNPNAGPAVDRAVELTGAALNQTGTDIPAGRYLVVTDVNLAQGYAVVRPADNTLNDDVDAVADTIIPAGGFGRIGVVAYNSNIDTTGQTQHAPVYLGQNGVAVFTPPSTGSLVQVGIIYSVGNPGFIASLEYVNRLAGSFQEDWRPNTFYPKNTLVGAFSPAEPELGLYLIRSKKDQTSQGVFDPTRPDFFDDWEIAGGDMKALLYDPNDVNSNVFDMDNMADGAAKVAMTLAERTKLAGLEDPNFKGYFNTPNELNTVYPTGQIGWSAIVIFENDGTTPNGNLWNWQDLPTPGWIDTGITGIGGDMNKAVYDPTNIAKDAFLMDHFVEGADVNKLFFTQAERTKLAAFSPATAYYLKTEVDALLALKADLTYVDAQDNLRMLTSLYDPGNVAGNVFDMDNMIEGATGKILTQAERDNIANNTSLAHFHANKALLDTITDAGDGEAYLANDGTYQDAAKAGIHNGTAIEQQEIYVVEETGNVFVDVEKVGGGDLQVYFGNDSYFLDCTTGAGVSGRARAQLTVGTPTTGTVNLVYVYLNGGVPELAVAPDNASLPTEFAWIGIIVIRDAPNVAIEGPLVLQRFTDAATHNDRGRLSYLGERIRVSGSKWWSGVEATVTITPNAGALDSIGLTVTSGEVYQLHRQIFPALDIASSSIYITGVSGGGALANYDKVLNLNAVNEYSDGTAIADGDYFNLAIYGVINKETGQCKLMVNPSSAPYRTANAAYNDADNLSNLSVDNDLRTVAFLIARIPLLYTTANNGTFVFINPAGKPQWIDLRGEILDTSDESGTGESSLTEAIEVTYDNTTSGLAATNVQDAIDEVVADKPTFLMGTVWTETTHTQAIGGAWIELTAPLQISAVSNLAVLKNVYRIGHNQAGKTYRCTVVVQASFDKAVNNQFVELGIGKNGVRVAEGYGSAFMGGNQDATEHTLSATFVVDISDTDEIGAFVSSPLTGGTYNIAPVQISVTGFELIP